MNSSPEEALFALALEKPAEKRALFREAICAGYLALAQGGAGRIVLGVEPLQDASADEIVTVQS